MLYLVLGYFAAALFWMEPARPCAPAGSIEARRWPVDRGLAEAGHRRRGSARGSGGVVMAVLARQVGQ